MHPDPSHVYSGLSPYSLVCDDALSFLRAQPADCVDLIFGSPPYSGKIRRYGTSGGPSLKGQSWVDFMVAIFAESSRICKGPVGMVVNGSTHARRYDCTPEMLQADLHRAGFHLHKAWCYRRDGVFGSGSKDWFRDQWEPVVWVHRPGLLPWSDNISCGHPPKFKPGGNPSNRKANGERTKGRAYKPPQISNPGNVLNIGCAGGGHMGHPLAHQSEAPFALALAERAVRSLCPPDGVVLDIFAGSSTTGHAALLHGRRYIGVDNRQSQVDLSFARLQAFLPGPFASQPAGP